MDKVDKCFFLVPRSLDEDFHLVLDFKSDTVMR